MFARKMADWSLWLVEVVCCVGFMMGVAISAFAQDPESAAEVGELSSPRQAEIVIPPGRPDWVEATSSNEKRADAVVVCSEPFAKLSSCQQALDDKLQQAVADFIANKTGSSFAPKLISYSLPEIKDRLIPAENLYEETIVSPSVGPMHQIHARVRFDDAFQHEVEHRWLQVRSTARLGQVGLGFITLLGFLGTIAGFFRADNATRGYYTGRLQLLAAGAILGMIVLGALFARWIPWI